VLLKFWGFSGLASLLASVQFPAGDSGGFVNPQISEARFVSGYFNMKIQNYYSILNLSEDSSCEELYQECRVLFVKYHPMTNKTEEAFRKFVSVNDAYGVLLDDEVRSDYDYLLSKYSEDNPVDLTDKKRVEEIMNIIIKRRKGMKEILNDNNSSFFSILLDVPISFSSDHSSGGVSNLAEGLSFPDLDLSFDFDFNLFDFVDLN